MKKQFKLLGYAGLLPFILIPIGIILDAISYSQGFTHFVQYSAIILSFFGGIHWFDALNEQRTDHQLYVAMLPSIVAWLSLIFLQAGALLMILSISFIAILMYDKFTLKLSKEVIVEYTYLRVLLTSVVIVSHLVMASI